MQSRTTSGCEPVESGRDAAHDAPRRSEEGPTHLTGQRIVVDVGRAEEPLQRDVDQRARAGGRSRRHRAEVGAGRSRRARATEAGSSCRPAVTDRRPREPVGVDRPLHVAGAGRARHGRRLVGVRPVAHLEPAAAGEELDVGAAQAQGLGDHPLVLHVGGPVPGRQDEHLLAGPRPFGPLPPPRGRPPASGPTAVRAPGRPAGAPARRPCGRRPATLSALGSGTYAVTRTARRRPARLGDFRA